VFFKHRHYLTKLCDRVSLPMLENAAKEDASILRSSLDEGSRTRSRSNSDQAWSAWMRDVEHPKRSTIVYMILSLAAADYWKEMNKIADNPDWSVSKNPFKGTNSDVIVAEALIFFWYNFFLFVREAVKRDELTQTDNQALSTAGTTVGHVVQETTGWPITDILRSRMDEYEKRDSTENPIEVFSRVVLRSIGKQTINEPDRRLPLSLEGTPVVVRTMIYMTAKLPAYFRIYKNIVEHYPMD
jgi:Arc/MetJ family transcription regulator